MVFFVKDDATKDFFNQNRTHFNSSRIKSDYAVSNLKSQWESANSSDYGGAEMSQDQLFYILLGCAMVKKFIPRGIHYKNERFQDGEIYLDKEASKIAMRITSYLNWTGFTFIPNNQQGIMKWKPINPVFNEKVKMSQDVHFLSYAIAQATNKITFPYYLPNVSTAGSGNPAQHTNYSYTSGRALWYGFGGIGAARNAFVKQDQAHMIALLNSLIGRSNNNPIYAGLISTWDVQHAPLIKQVLFGGSNPYFTKKSYRDMLDEAPCTGPFVFSWQNGNVGKNPMGGNSYEWSTSDRITHPERRGGNSFQFTGEFPGLDYMLYHNLYYLIEKDEYKNPVNLMNKLITKELPITLQWLNIGTSNAPLLIKAFGNIEARNKN